MCAAGAMTECGRIFREVVHRRPEWPHTLAEPPEIPTYPARMYGQRYLNITLLGYAVHEFGEERFEEFWTSDEDVEVAFANAFGISPGEWLRDFIRARFGDVRAGAGVSAGDTLASVAFLLACLLAALHIGRRRPVQRHAQRGEPVRQPPATAT